MIKGSSKWCDDKWHSHCLLKSTIAGFITIYHMITIAANWYLWVERLHSLFKTHLKALPISANTATEEQTMLFLKEAKRTWEKNIVWRDPEIKNSDVNVTLIMPMSTITASVDSRNKQNNYFSTQLSRAQAPQALYITKPLCQKISFLRAIYTGISRTANSHVIKMRRFFLCWTYLFDQ